jgi:TorA maturation chaperone TorD
MALERREQRNVPGEGKVAAVATDDHSPLTEEDRLRADMYEFLASLLRQEPSDELLGHVVGLQGDGSAIGSASSVLVTLATKIPNDEIRDEYMRLFIGVGRGEILPYASYYLTGFLNDKPLAKLRNAMQVMGIERADGVKDPEDHIASLFDIMAGLIRGNFDAPDDLAAQAAFSKLTLIPGRRS